MSPDDAKQDGCQEAALGLPFYAPCNRLAVKMIGWRGRSDTPLRICAMCADHNIRNRGGYEVKPYVPLAQQEIPT